MEERDGDFLCEGGAKNDVEIVTGDDEEEPQRRILMGEPFKIEAYVSIYAHRTKIMRLLFIADRYSGDSQETLQLAMLRMAYEEIKKGMDEGLLWKVVKKIRGRLGPNYEMDRGWCDRVGLMVKMRKEMLEHRLILECKANDYMASLNLQNPDAAENVSLMFADLGDFFYAHGDPIDAISRYFQGLEYCMSPGSQAHMLIKVIIVCIAYGHFNVVVLCGERVEAVKELDPFDREKLRCALGLAYLNTKRFKRAADKFVEISPALGSHFLEMVSPHDIAIYGALCALATFERTELKASLYSKPILHRYSSCFEYLESLRKRLLFDIHLHDHFEGLFDRIRHKAFLLYIRPYVSVDLKIMAKAFRTDDKALADKLRALINTGQIQARMDTKNKVLYAQRANQTRNITFQRMLQSCIIIECNVRSMLLRAILSRRHYYLYPRNRRREFS